MARTWIRADVNFGVPYKQFTLKARGGLGRDFHRAVAGMENDLPEEWEKVVKDLLARTRPQHKQELLVVTDISVDPYRACWVFGVISPEFSRTKIEGTYPPIENLEVCCSCGKPLPTGFDPMDGMIYLVTKDTSPNFGKEVCSEDCFNKEVSGG